MSNENDDIEQYVFALAKYGFAAAQLAKAWGRADDGDKDGVPSDVRKAVENVIKAHEFAEGAKTPEGDG